MDAKQLDQVVQEFRGKSAESVAPVELKYFIEYLKEAVTGESREAFHLSHDSVLEDFGRVIGLDTLKNKKVLRRYLYNTTNMHETMLSDGFTVGEDVAPGLMLTYIADCQSVWADDPNDYIAGFAVELDAGTSIVFAEKSFELDDDSCEYDRWILICRPGDIKNIDWDRGELFGG